LTYLYGQKTYLKKNIEREKKCHINKISATSAPPM